MKNTSFPYREAKVSLMYVMIDISINYRIIKNGEAGCTHKNDPLHYSLLFHIQNLRFPIVKMYVFIF